MRRTLLWVSLALFVGSAVGASGIYAYLTHIQHLAIPHTKETTDDALAEYTLWLMIFTGLLAAATIGLGVATVGLYRTGEKQVELTRQALVGDQRAWLVTELEIGPEGVRSRNGHLVADVQLKVTNVGRTIAVRAHTNMTVISDVLTTSKKVSELAASSKSSEPEFGLTVAPNGFYHRPWFPTMDDEDTDNRGPSRDLTPVIIGCVTYEVLQDKELHQTAFAYILGAKDGSPWGGRITANTELAADDVTVKPWAGGFAT